MRNWLPLIIVLIFGTNLLNAGSIGHGHGNLPALTCPPIVPGINQSCTSSCCSTSCSGICCSNGCGSVCYDGTSNPQCPPIPKFGPCVIDGRCANNAKECKAAGGICCSNGCGASCITPPSHPSCPPLEPGQVGICLFDERCVNNGLICKNQGGVCCSNGCGLICNAPPPAPPPPPPPPSHPSCPPLKPGQAGICLFDERCGDNGLQCKNQGGVCCSNGCGLICNAPPAPAPPPTPSHPKCPTVIPDPTASICLVDDRCLGSGHACQKAGGICCSNSCGGQICEGAAPEVSDPISPTCPDPASLDICIEDTSCMNTGEKCVKNGGTCCKTSCESLYCQLPGKPVPGVPKPSSPEQPSLSCPKVTGVGSCRDDPRCDNEGAHCSRMGGICCSNGCGDFCHLGD